MPRSPFARGCRGLRVLVVLLVVGFGSTHAWASIQSFNFVDASSGNALAVMTLTILPAGIAEIDSFEITDDGAALFGYSEGAYGGTFDSATGAIVAEGPTGLTGNGKGGFTYVVDNEPPPSIGYGTPLFFEMQFGSGASGDYLLIGDDKFEMRHGDWQLSAVPEPASLLVWTSMLVGLIMFQHRRNRLQPTCCSIH